MRFSPQPKTFISKEEKLRLKSQRAVVAARERRRKQREKLNAEAAAINPLLVSATRSNGSYGKFRKGKVIKCKECGKERYCTPSGLKMFCGNECKTAFRKKQSERTCIVCGEKFYASNSELFYRNRKTCSRKCRGEYDSKNRLEINLNSTEDKRLVERRLRYNKQADEWKKSVFVRDNYTCQQCGARNGKGKAVYLHAHHIKQWAFHPELRYDVSNGETLCTDCHRGHKHEYRKRPYTLTSLTTQLDKWFSLYIRLREADENGMVKCYTSGKILHYTKMQAGHFIGRAHMALRWEEMNVRPQSPVENINFRGNPKEFERRLRAEHGNEAVDVLIAKKHDTYKPDRVWMEQQLEKYKLLVKEIQSKKAA